MRDFSPSPSSSSSSSRPSSRSSTSSAAASTRRLPWTPDELSALIAGVAEHGKDWVAIMADARFGPALKRRTLVACRKQFMFGRAMAQWREGRLLVPRVDDIMGDEVKHLTRSRTSTPQGTARAVADNKKAEEEEDEEDEEEDESEEEEESDDSSSLSEVDSTDDDDGSSTDVLQTANRRVPPWLDIKDSELPAGKQKREYRSAHASLLSAPHPTRTARCAHSLPPSLLSLPG